MNDKTQMMEKHHQHFFFWKVLVFYVFCCSPLFSAQLYISKEETSYISDSVDEATEPRDAIVFVSKDAVLVDVQNSSSYQVVSLPHYETDKIKPLYTKTSKNSSSVVTQKKQSKKTSYTLPYTNHNSLKSVPQSDKRLFVDKCNSVVGAGASSQNFKGREGIVQKYRISFDYFFLSAISADFTYFDVDYLSIQYATSFTRPPPVLA